MGRKLTDGGVAEIQKMSPQQLGDVIKQWSGESQPMGARHGDTAANHNSTHFFGVVDWTLTHCFWSTGWEVISKSPSHYSMQLRVLYTQNWVLFIFFGALKSVPRHHVISTIQYLVEVHFWRFRPVFVRYSTETEKKLSQFSSVNGISVYTTQLINILINGPSTIINWHGMENVQIYP